MELALSFRFNDGTEVRRLGYGAMRLTGQPGNFGPYQSWDDGKRVLKRALELGINFIDTARAYGPGWNEKLVAEALHPYPEGLFLATKGGVVKKSATERYLDGSPNGLRRDCEESLKNLRVDCIDLYQLHWVDPDVPLNESVLGLARLQQEGKIRLIGLSNITVKQLEEARSIAQIASVQNRYSVGERKEDQMIWGFAKNVVELVAWADNPFPNVHCDSMPKDIEERLVLKSFKYALSKNGWPFVASAIKSAQQCLGDKLMFLECPPVSHIRRYWFAVINAAYVTHWQMDGDDGAVPDKFLSNIGGIAAATCPSTGSFVSNAGRTEEMIAMQQAMSPAMTEMAQAKAALKAAGATTILATPISPSRSGRIEAVEAVRGLLDEVDRI